VLEFASGTGVFGLAVARFAERVVMSDFHPVIVKNLQNNVQFNLRSPLGALVMLVVGGSPSCNGKVAPNTVCGVVIAF